MKCRIEFPDTSKPTVELECGSNLAEKLNIHNSPILFGCRIGICGTCAIEVLEEEGEPLHPRTEEEKNFLETLAPGEDKLRLACQVKLNTHIKVRKAVV